MMKRGFAVLMVVALVGLGLWFFAGVSPNQTQDKAAAVSEAEKETNESLGVVDATSETETTTVTTTEKKVDEKSLDFEEEFESFQTLDVKREYFLEGVLKDTNGNRLGGVPVKLLKQQFENSSYSYSGGIPITWKRLEEKEQVTTPQWYYVFPLEMTDNALLLAEPEGFGMILKSITPRNMVFEEETEGRMVATLDLLAKEATFYRITVQDEEETPLEGAQVELFLSPTHEGWSGLGNSMRLEKETDAKGEVRLFLQSMSHIKANVSLKGYSTQSIFLHDNFLEQVVTLTKDGGTISGVVYSGTEGEIPASGASVSLYTKTDPSTLNLNPYRLERMADEDGRFEFQDLGEGLWEVMAVQGNLMAHGKAPRDMKEVNLGKAEQIIDIVLRVPDSSPTFELLVIDAFTSKPLEMVYLTETYGGKLLAVESNPHRTNANGVMDFSSFQMTNDQLREYLESTQLMKAGYKPLSMDEVISELYGEKNKDIATAAMIPDNRVRLRGVLEYADGRRASGIRVTSNPNIQTAKQTYTDQQGRFEMQVPGEDVVVLKFDVPNYPLNYSRRIVTGTEDVTLFHRLDPGGALEVRVLDPEGKPAEGVQVGLMRRTYGEQFSGSDVDGRETSDALGIVKFEMLPSSTSPLDNTFQRVSVDLWIMSKEYDAKNIRNVKITAGETTRIDYPLEVRDRSAFIDGFVIDDEGNPVEGAEVQTYLSEYSIWASDVTDALGAFQLEELKPATYSLQVYHEGKHAFVDVKAPSEGIRISIGKKP